MDRAGHSLPKVLIGQDDPHRILADRLNHLLELGNDKIDGQHHGALRAT
jgi:hypothetical protein